MSGLNIENIIRMAREADLWGEIYAMQRFAQLVAAAEREACAEIAEKHFTYYGYQYIADDIRSRGQE